MVQMIQITIHQAILGLINRLTVLNSKLSNHKKLFQNLSLVCRFLNSSLNTEVKSFTSSNQILGRKLRRSEYISTKIDSLK